jgi:predicted AlkP superfamily phosphohydrolase/phosphomutase
MPRPVVAICLDAADPALLRDWIEEERLPNLARLFGAGAFGEISNLAFPTSEIVWTTFLTGAAPARTGYWGPRRFDARNYDVVQDPAGAYDFLEFPPFYALGAGRRVAIFDLPQARIDDGVDGVQVLGWGARGAFCASGSRPEGLYRELVTRHGGHPTYNRDAADCRDPERLAALARELEEGARRRAAIAKDLLRRERWSLFLTSFSETHSAGHSFWHVSRPGHPLHGLVRMAEDPLLAVYRAVDAAVGEVVAAAPADAYVVLFSDHGMVPNHVDLPGMVFLPELLYRRAFPGRYGFARGGAGRPGAPILEGSFGSALYWLREEKSLFRRALRRVFPGRFRANAWPLRSSALSSRLELERAGASLYYHPTLWYRPSWPAMRAFALPTYSEAAVRVNLEGREARGLVSRRDFESLLDEVEEDVRGLTNARTGRPLAREVLRTRRPGAEDDPRGPDGDLVVFWREGEIADTADTARHGRIGPVPFFRTSAHRPCGFVSVAGPGIEPGTRLLGGHALDLAPTILELMGAPVPARLEGRPLLPRAGLGATAA